MNEKSIKQENFNKAMALYENQIERYNAFCERQINKNFPRENLKEGEI